jgi:hypothetical protein
MYAFNPSIPQNVNSFYHQLGSPEFRISSEYLLKSIKRTIRTIKKSFLRIKKKKEKNTKK